MVRNGQFLRDWKASHSHCIWMSARPMHGAAFLSCWFTLKGVCCCCEEIWSKRKRVFEDDVFIENTCLVSGSKTQDLNLRADLVLNMSRDPPGQWFPETEYWASAIFVGTSGIPPKLIYRSVKSYKELTGALKKISGILGFSFWELFMSPPHITYDGICLDWILDFGFLRQDFWAHHMISIYNHREPLPHSLDTQELPFYWPQHLHLYSKSTCNRCST